MTSHAGSIYFAQGVDGGPIKIGHSTSPFERLRALNTASAERLAIIALFPGSEFDERRLHAALAEHRLNGEWFRDCEAVRAVIAPRDPAPKPAPVDALVKTRDALTLAIDAFGREDYSAVCEILEGVAISLREGAAVIRDAA